MICIPLLIEHNLSIVGRLVGSTIARRWFELLNESTLRWKGKRRQQMDRERGPRRDNERGQKQDSDYDRHEHAGAASKVRGKQTAMQVSATRARAFTISA
jgi:hypothetical protein